MKKDFWRCNHDEHINKLTEKTCEICNEKRPEIIIFNYELTDVYGKIKLIWKTENAVKVFIIRKKEINEVGLNGEIEIEDVKNKEDFELQVSNITSDFTLITKILLKKPEIVSFISDKSKVLIGDYITVDWHTINAKEVAISKIGNVESAGVQFLNITDNQPIKLTVINEIGALEKTLELEILPPPNILLFKADQSKICKGKSTELVWKVENALNIKLESLGSISQVTNDETKLISPTEHTEYKLNITALDGKTVIEQLITVEVFEEGQISFFKADRQFVFPTIPVVLAWEVKNAVKVEIEGIGFFQLTGQTTVQPLIDTIYKLIVTDNFGTFNEELQIKMLPLPVIESLFVPIPIINIESNLQIDIPKFPNVDVSINNFQNGIQLAEQNIHTSLPNFNLISFNAIELKKEETKTTWHNVILPLLSKVSTVNNWLLRKKKININKNEKNY